MPANAEASASLSAIVRPIEKEAVRLNYHWIIHDQLCDSGDDNLQILNKSGSRVFHLLQVLIIENTIMTISRLLDPARQGSNWNASIPHALELLDKAIEASEYETFLAQFEKLKQVSGSIRRHRRKRLAHLDLTIATIESPSLLPDITWGEIEDAVELLKTLAADLCRATGTPPPDYRPHLLGGGDGNKLISVLRKAHGVSSHDI